MKTQFLIAAATAFLSQAIPVLHGGERLDLESAIYVFKQSAFHEIRIPDTAAAHGQALVFKSPATARFDQLTLSLEDSRIGWNGGSSVPEQFGLVAVPPTVPIALDRPVTMTSSVGIQYLEQTADKGFQVREIRSDSPEAPHVVLSFTVGKSAGPAGDLLLACDLDIATVYARERIPGVALEVGKPTVVSFKEKEMIPMRSGQRAAILLKGPNGSDYSLLLLLRLAYANARGVAPQNGPQSSERAGVRAGAAASEESGGPIVGDAMRADTSGPAPRIEVIFDRPEEYIDSNLRSGPDWYREMYFSRVRGFLVKLAGAMLPEGYDLKITFTDIDLGYRDRGTLSGFEGFPYSYYSSSTPAMEFTYSITDATGAVVRHGTVRLRNNWVFAPLTTETTDVLRFEKAMLKEWASTGLANLEVR